MVIWSETGRDGPDKKKDEEENFEAQDTDRRVVVECGVNCASMHVRRYPVRRR